MVIFCALLLGGLSLSSSRWGHRSRLSQSPATSPQAHSVDLKWNASLSHVLGYYVYRSENFKGPYRKLNSSAVPTTNYTDATVQAGRTYFYKVTAVGAKGQESMFSVPVKAAVPFP